MARLHDSVLAWLDVLDVDYLEVDGWRTRGNDSFNPVGSVNHHTAGARRGVAPSLGTCINGRPDVPGPLCHGLLGRDRVLRLIASGRANHAGRGGTRGMVGNSSCFGLEVEHTGVAATEPIDWQQVDVAARVHAAWALAAGYSGELVVQHWEWTTRKIDFVKGSVDPDWFRSEVARYMRLATSTRPSEQKEQLIMDAEVQAALDAMERRLTQKINDAIGSIWSDEATDETHDETTRRNHGSTRGWLAAIAEKLGVTRDDAMRHDPTHQA